MKLEFGDAVRQALREGRPIVALETTVVTHGMQAPHNIDTALAMESAISEEGACPATIGICGGRIKVGMSADDIRRFGDAEANSIAKCSRRDLPAIVARGADGSLTVAGTVLVAHAAGIDLVATGGIGGVHRQHPFDVSADLRELGRTPVTVVCAGAKSILDLPRTLEVLETEGVPVVGLGTRTLPAFFSRDSGLPVPHSVDDVAGAAALYRSWRDIAAGNGLLLTVPVPEADALPSAEADAAIEQAIRDADAAGISGSDATPYLLARVVELTSGRSLAANESLLINNARVAAQIAVAAIGA